MSASSVRKGALAGKRALVTGASTGIGAAIATAYAAEGAHVAVHARTADKAEPVLGRVRAAGGDAFAVAADLADRSAIGPMCRAAIEGLGGIDIVVNNAGVFESHRILDVDLGHWDLNFALHVTAPLLITRLTVPAMIAQGSGCLVYTASTASREADAGWAAYTASRHATVGLMKAAAAEFGKHGIRANALAPGWVDTPMARRHFERQAAESGEDFDALYRTEIASGMLRARVTPQSVADTAVFLASDGARHVTAQTLYVCAGTVAT